MTFIAINLHQNTLQGARTKKKKKKKKQDQQGQSRKRQFGKFDKTKDGSVL